MTIGQDLDNEFDALYSICQELEVKLKNNADELVSFMNLQKEMNENIHQSLSAIETILTQYGNRLSVLEEYHSTPTPEPNVFPWPVYILDLTSNALMPLNTNSIELDYYNNSAYTIQVGDGEALDVGRPVKFYLNGGLIGQENHIPIHAAGDNNPIQFIDGTNNVKIESGDGKIAEFAIIKKKYDTSPPVISGIPQSQVNPWWPIIQNTEEPFINLIKAGRNYWEGGGMKFIELIGNGYIDTKTGYPLSLPNGEALKTVGYFTPDQFTSQTNPHWDGNWVLECDGDVTLGILHAPSNLVKRIRNNRIEFTRNETTRDFFQFTIKEMNGPISNFRLYRKENEEAIKAGKIYNPKYIEAISKYDIVRTMDLQSVNGSIIGKVEDFATLDSMSWSDNDWSAATGEPHFQVPSLFQSQPLEATFAIAIESGCKLWHQAPITLGMTDKLFSYRPDNDRIDIWASNFAEGAKLKAREILESNEWDRYADAFVEAIINSGYPEDRPIYTSLANEVWNYAGHYFLTTVYAQRMGDALAPQFGMPNGGGFRAGYGILLGRYKLAIDAALKRANRNQKIVFVVEGQAAWIEMTGYALEPLNRYLETIGENWNDHKDDFGVSVASYWGYNEGVDASGIDPNDLNALKNHFLNGSENLLGTKANVIKLFKGAISEANKYGVKFIGAYEGGPHFSKPSTMTKANYDTFMWGEYGAEVNVEINKALIDEFGDNIISNYALDGPAYGQPWFEGYSTPYKKSWDDILAYIETKKITNN